MSNIILETKISKMLYFVILLLLWWNNATNTEWIELLQINSFCKCLSGGEKVFRLQKIFACYIFSSKDVTVNKLRYTKKVQSKLCVKNFFKLKAYVQHK